MDTDMEVFKNLLTGEIVVVYEIHDDEAILIVEKSENREKLLKKILETYPMDTSHEREICSQFDYAPRLLDTLQWLGFYNIDGVYGLTKDGTEDMFLWNDGSFRKLPEKIDMYSEPHPDLYNSIDSACKLEDDDKMGVSVVCVNHF